MVVVVVVVIGVCKKVIVTLITVLKVLFNKYIYRSQHSSVSIVTGPWAGQSKFQILAAGQRGFSLPQNIQTSSGA